MKIEILTDRYYEGSIPEESGRFRKWMKINHPEVEVVYPAGATKYDLHDYSIVMPFVSLLSDMSLSNYLMLVMEYIKVVTSDKLPGEAEEVIISALYHDEKEGIRKEFNFKGSADALRKTVKKFDLNKFMDDKSV